MVRAPEAGPIVTRAPGRAARIARRLRALVVTALGVCALLLTVGPRPAHAGGMAQGDWTAIWAFAQLADIPAEVYGQPIAEIRFEGNRRVESEAMLLELDSSVGEICQARKLGADLKRLWGLGYFEDVAVEGELGTRGVILTYVVKERPTVRKIIVEGNDKIKLDDINEQLDLEKNQVLDLGKVKANLEKVKQLYTDGGFFLADVSYELRPIEKEPGKVDIAIIIDEAAEVVVRNIEFVGNKAFSDKDLRKHILTKAGSYISVVAKKAGGVFNKEAFQQDFSFLRAFYGDNGYLDANPKDPELSLTPDRRFVMLTIPIEEGPQYKLGALTAREVLVKGESRLFDSDTLAESIDPVIKPGDVASMGKIQKIREDVERRYKDNGYAYVNVNADQRFDRERLLLYVNFSIEKGPLVYVERIEINGNEKTADKVIRREMTISEGDLYSETNKETSEFRIMRLGYFSAVNMSTSRGSTDDKIVINIELTEQLTGTFQVGAGFSTIENFVLQGQVAYDNFLGRGATVQVIAQFSSLRRLFNFSYYTRHFLDSKWNFIFNVFNSRNIFPSFSRQSTGFRVSWGYPVWRDLTAFIGYELEDVKVGFGTFGSIGGVFSPGSLVTVPQQALITNLFANGITSALEARLQWDTRDNFLFPTSGQYHQLRGTFANKYLGSQNRYNRYVLDSRFYFPVIRTEKAFRAWLVFKTRLQVGFVHGTRKNGVPIFERWFPGGIYGDGEIRGFRLRSLGPKIKVASSPDPTSPLIPYEIGGNLLTAFTAEFEFMVIPPANIKGVVFYDMGNAFNTESHFCNKLNPSLLPKSDPCMPRWGLKELRYSAGFGFRWQSPIGPLRFEWGFPLDRQRANAFLRRGDDPVVFEFAIGNSF